MFRRYACLTLAALLSLAVLTACSKSEHRTVTVREEQHEGEVEPVAPGEMIVE